MDIQITYETLFDLLRKERGLSELQELDVSFWEQAVSYMRERNDFFSRTSQAEQEKTRLQIQNIKLLLREIYERREKKILNLALNVIKADNPSLIETKQMLPGYKDRMESEDMTKPVVESTKEGEEYLPKAPVSSDEKIESVQAPTSTEGEEEILVKFVTSVPKFLGKNKQVFGPYEIGTITSLPVKITEILLKKNKIEKVMAS
jgi:DNA replication initiation complex subunit (GINS family)